jgi:hypothetical protein
LSPRPQSLAKVAGPLQDRPSGEMAEWLKAHAWKACVRETVPWVRIPLSPPFQPKPRRTTAWRQASKNRPFPYIFRGGESPQHPKQAHKCVWRTDFSPHLVIAEQSRREGRCVSESKPASTELTGGAGFTYEDTVASANGWRDSAAGRLELSIASPRRARITESVGRPDRPGRSTELGFGADGSL